jgi:hypothetical protein
VFHVLCSSLGIRGRSRRFFHLFPQGISVLHRFCTSGRRFAIAPGRRLKQSIRQRRRGRLTSLRRLPSWRDLAVLEGELPGGSENVLRRVAGTWALRPPQRVLLTLGTEPPESTICRESGARTPAARPIAPELEIRRCAPMRISLEVCFARVPRRAMRRCAGFGVHEAMRPEWLARAAFVFGAARLLVDRPWSSVLGAGSGLYP